MGNKNSNSDSITFTCESCGNRITTYGKVTRCRACGRATCKHCIAYDLCPEDFHNLSEKEQKLLMSAKKTLEGTEKAQPLINGGFLITLSVGIVLLILIAVVDGYLYTILGGTFGGLAVVMAFAILGIGKLISKVVASNAKDQIEKVLIRERRSRVKDGPNECPNCGGNVPPFAKTCEWCGDRLE